MLGFPGDAAAKLFFQRIWPPAPMAEEDASAPAALAQGRLNGLQDLRTATHEFGSVPRIECEYGERSLSGLVDAEAGRR